MEEIKQTLYQIRLKILKSNELSDTTKHDLANDIFSVIAKIGYSDQQHDKKEVIHET